MDQSAVLLSFEISSLVLQEQAGPDRFVAAVRIALVTRERESLAVKPRIFSPSD
jgi:hypothetical protein